MQESTATIDNKEPQESFWSIIKEAVLGSHRDFTKGPIGQSIILLSVPMVLEMVLESVFALTDIFFVAKLGADAIATVGLTESMMTMVYTLVIGLSIGASATVARRIGEKDPEAAAHSAVQSLYIGAIVSVILGVTGVLFAPNLLRFMGASESVVAMGSNFTRVMIGGNAAVTFLFLINAIFRGVGDAAIAMRVLWLANGINIVLGPLLIFGIGPFPELGVTGAAIATTIGRGTGALFAFSKLVRKGGRITIARRHLRPDPEMMWRLVRLSGTGTFQVFIGMASWIGLVRIVSTFGSEAVAGYQIGIRIILFALLPSWGMSNAAATMVGQSLGAKNPERAEHAVWLAGFYNMIFLGLIGLIFVLFPHYIVQFFTHDATVFNYGVDCLRTVAFGFLFYAYGMVLTQSFNGAGDTRTPTIINLFVFWLFEIPLAYALSVSLGYGPKGVFLSIMIAFSILAVVSAIVFRQGKWKLKIV